MYVRMWKIAYNENLLIINSQLPQSLYTDSFWNGICSNYLSIYFRGATAETVCPTASCFVTLLQKQNYMRKEEESGGKGRDLRLTNAAHPGCPSRQTNSSSSSRESKLLKSRQGKPRQAKGKMKMKKKKKETNKQATVVIGWADENLSIGRIKIRCLW